MSAPITWKRVEDELPDDTLTVLMAMEDGEVCTGFLDGEQWRYESADPVEGEVKYWADFPAPPTS